MMEECKLNEPNTLMACLQLMASLSHSSSATVKCRVMEGIKEDLGKYCDGTYLTSLTKDDSNGYFYNVFEGAKNLLNEMLSAQDNFGDYKTIQADCAHKVVGYIIAMLPQVYSVLYFLYFNASDQTGTIKGGKWKRYNVNPSQGSTTVQLSQWLKDDNSMKGLPFMPRGFRDDQLLNNSGFGITKKLAMLVSHSTAGSLQRALVPILFLGPWNDSKLGHACLLLYYFCNRIKGNPLESQFTALYSLGTFDGLKKLCRKLKQDLKPFLYGTATVLSAVCQRNNDLYWGIFDHVSSPQLTKCIEWLGVYLPSIIGTLSSMSSDCTKWNPDNLTNASTAGPFRYGFVFRDKWEGASPQRQLQDHICRLVGSLDRFFIALLEPTTLKKGLQLLAKLSTLLTLKSKVKQHFKAEVEQYCGPNYSAWFENYLTTTFTGASWLLGQSILSTRDQYGPYKELNDSRASHDNCVQGIVKALKVRLPQVYSSLYFLYYNVSTECTGIRGGGWSDHRLSTSDTNLVKWLKDGTLQGQKTLTPGLITSGFEKSELKPTSKGWTMAGDLTRLVSRTNAASLQNALCGMMLISITSETLVEDPSLTGHAVLFMHELCQQVIRNGALQKRFAEVYCNGQATWSELKTLCTQLNIHLEKFIGHSANSGICAVCQYNTNLYKSVWDDSKFSMYVKWIKYERILDKLTTSLNRMKSDCIKWEQDKLKQASSAGPFKYGFVFHRTWNGTSSSIQTGVSNAISALTTGEHSLDKLREKLDELQEKDAQKEEHGGGNEQVNGAGQDEEESSEEEEDEEEGTDSWRAVMVPVVSGVGGVVGGLSGLGALGYVLRVVM